MNDRRLALLMRAVILISVGAVLGMAFYEYSFSFFYLDDLNNISLARFETAGSLTGYLFDPMGAYFRPLGMVVYAAFWRLFDLTPFPYHAFAWLLHAVSTLLVFLIARRLVGSTYAGGVAAVLFAFEAAYADVLWNFGDIFEILCGCLFFLALWIYMKAGDTIPGLLAVPVVFFFAMSGKEMAVTLPAVILLYELLVRPGKVKPLWLVGRIAVVSLGAIRFFASFGGSMLKANVGGMSPSDPYYLEFSWDAVRTGYTWYLNGLFFVDWRWTTWLAVTVALGIALVLRRSWIGVFCIALVYVALSPVVLLVNHRVDFFWYIPFLGVACLAALAVRAARDLALWKLSWRTSAYVGIPLFALCAGLHYFYQRELERPSREWAKDLTKEYRAFVTGLRGLPELASQKVVYFATPPRHFEKNSLSSALRVAFDRDGISAEVVTGSPPPGAYLVRYVQSELKVVLERPKAACPSNGPPRPGASK
jgi:hypothetical protein